jgi:TRAP-type mannitol/chloroaromatic compound transport system permease small subunit
MRSIITRPIGLLSEFAGGVATAAALLLIIVTLYEVIARYVFRAPTLWGYDVGYMLNGAAFVLACGLALKKNQHVSVDILSQLFSPRLKRIIEVVVFTLLVAPALGLICFAAWAEFIKAFMTGEIEQVSPWRPKIWPFRLVLAVGLTALWLQVIARIIEPHRDEDGGSH